MIFLVVIVLVVLKLISKLTIGRTKSGTCLVGKTAIVTGGNAGMGYQIALRLASRGARVIIADKDDAEESKNAIIQDTQNPNVVAKRLDLSSLQSVRDFAKDVRETEKRLDILVHNAGVGGLEHHYTEDKIFAVYQINYLGAFLLTHLLVDLLKNSAPSRIIFTSSLLAFVNNLTTDNFNKCPEFENSLLRHLFAYGNSKLAKIVVADGFAEKLKGAGVTSNSLHPGLVYTGIFRKMSVSKLVSSTILDWLLWYPWSKSPEEGVQTCLHLCLSKSLKNTTGKYFADCRSIPKPLKAYNTKFRQELWTFSENAVGLTDSEKL